MSSTPMLYGEWVADELSRYQPKPPPPPAPPPKRGPLANQPWPRCPQCQETLLKAPANHGWFCAPCQKDYDEYQLVRRLKPVF